MKMGPGDILELPKSYDYSVDVTNSTAAEVSVELYSPYDDYCQKKSRPAVTLAPQASVIVKAIYQGCVNGGGSAIIMNYTIKDAVSKEVIVRGDIHGKDLKDGSKVVCKDKVCELVK
jgi:hypothetical protein